jgi:hypothetical protein
MRLVISQLLEQLLSDEVDVLGDLVGRSGHPPMLTKK